jgi:BirA family biotin operon repressor/biotin-[acetyl-CoA-carboxylase] ligase
MRAPVRPLTFEVLKRLTHERFVSGEALAAALGVSRASVSEALQGCGVLGVEVFRLAGKGYRLAVPLELIDLPRLVERLGKHARRLDVDVVDLVDSTNRVIAERLGAGAPGGTCLVAELQTAGRGRRDRKWFAPFGASLAFTLGWRFDKGVGELGGLPLAVGVAVARALNRMLPARPVQLKWPNDIVAGGKKLGGVLIEAQGEIHGPTAVAIGIGLNVRLPESLHTAIDQPVTDVESLAGEGVSRNALLADVLARLVDTLDEFAQAGFAAFATEWNTLHALAGTTVRVHPGDGSWFDAEVAGVAHDGALRVMEGGVMRVVTSGEVSVRLRA